MMMMMMMMMMTRVHARIWKEQAVIRFKAFTSRDREKQRKYYVCLASN
jgi:hypothetical protein